MFYCVSLISFMKNKCLLLLLCLLLSGCSLTFIYNNVDWWVNWYLDDYVELDRQQQKIFDNKLDELHLWHRTTQLVRYAEQAKVFKEQVNAGITKDQLKEHRIQIKEHWTIFINKLAPELSQLTTLLSNEQIKKLKENLAKDNEKQLKNREPLEQGEWQEQRAEESIDNLKEWFGRLTSQQKQDVTTMAKGYQSTFDYWIEYRKLWQQEFFKLVSNDPEQLFIKGLTELFLHGRDRLRSQEYNEISAQNDEILVDIMHYQMNNVSNKQLKKFNRKLDDLIENLTELAQDN